MIMSYIFRMKVQCPPLSSFLCRIFRTFTSRPVAGCPITLKFYFLMSHILKNKLCHIIHAYTDLSMTWQVIPPCARWYLCCCPPFWYPFEYPASEISDRLSSIKCVLTLWGLKGFQFLNQCSGCICLKTRLSVSSFWFSTKGSVRPLERSQWVLWAPFI